MRALQQIFASLKQNLGFSINPPKNSKASVQPCTAIATAYSIQPMNTTNLCPYSSRAASNTRTSIQHEYHNTGNASTCCHTIVFASDLFVIRIFTGSAGITVRRIKQITILALPNCKQSPHEKNLTVTRHTISLIPRNCADSDGNHSREKQKGRTR